MFFVYFSYLNVCIMKTTSTILLMICSVILQAQTSVYHPFPDSTACWTVYVNACCYNTCQGPPTPNPYIADHNFSYYLSGDTVINSMTYHKIYKNGNVHEHCAMGGNVDNWEYINHEYYGATRQDVLQRKVYYYSGNQECLL